MARRTFAVAIVFCLVCPGAWVPGVGAQEVDGRSNGTPRVAAVLAPDTVRVGEPFTLGLSVAAPREATIHFPPLLSLPAELEQLRPVDVGWDEGGGGQWRARYRLAVWKAGSWSFPPVEVEWQGRRVELTPPPVHVVSVLPAASQGPQPLEGPRDPSSKRAFPWWLLLLLLALALLGWLLRRLRRTGVEEEEDEVDPADAARTALAALKRDLEEGDIDLAAFYDGLETVLRRYLAARRDWPEERPIREFVGTRTVTEARAELYSGLRTMQDRAGLVRFAHVEATALAALLDVDACLAWVEAEEEAA